MSIGSRYLNERQQLRTGAVLRDGLIVLVLVVLLAWFWPLRTVPTGHRGVITVGGAIRGIKGEGFTLVAPWQVLDIFNVRAEQSDVKDAQGATSDQQQVTTSLTIRYSIQPNKVAEVFEQYSRDGNLDSYVETASLEVFKAVTARYTATELLAKRPQVSSDIATALRAKLMIYGAQVINIDMTNFAFSPSYMAAINEKTTQEQLRLAAVNKVFTVEAQQKEKVAIAEAEATALKAKADGEAYAQLKMATAQADSLRIQNAAIAQNRDVLELRRIEVEKIKAERWDGALPSSIYAGTPIPFFDPLNAKKD